MTREMREAIVWAARNEITEYHMYSRVAAWTHSDTNKQILETIASEEKMHYERWKTMLGHDVRPVQWKVVLYPLITRILGLTFGLRLMEQGERLAARMYQDLAPFYAEAAEIIRDEQRHEEQLLNLIDEQRLQYVSSFVLGLNDALVELTGALAGLTLALSNTRLISMVGLITGIAASCAMAGSEYLSTKEEQEKNALRAGVTTGIAYLVTVLLLILPYLLFDRALVALGTTLGTAVTIIAAFTFYTSVVKKTSFRKKFSEMLFISIGAAIFNFGIGYAIKTFFDI